MSLNSTLQRDRIKRLTIIFSVRIYEETTSARANARGTDSPG